MKFSSSVFIAALAFAVAICFGQETAIVKYQKRAEMIPMRDGVRLYTQIFIPEGREDWPKTVTYSSCKISGGATSQKASS
jgi:predicted acyl esterase